MEYILIPTDFSKSALNALLYGVNVAGVYNSKILVLHTYEMPAAGASSIKNIDNKMREFAEQDMAKFQKAFAEANTESNIDVKFEIINSSLISGINYMLKHNDVGLVVMGTKGASGMKEFFIGSNTSEAIAKVDCPVLAIPENAVYKKIDNIVFATDFDMTCGNNHLPLIFRLTRYLKSKLHIVNIQTDKTNYKKSRDNADAFFEKCGGMLEGVDYEQYFVLDDRVQDGINKACLENNADLLVMKKKSYGLIDLIFKKSFNKEIVSEAKIPLLVIK